MSHANAVLTPRTRLRLGRLVVDKQWTYAAAAKMSVVSARTARKWAERSRSQWRGGMADRSSRPHTSPAETTPGVVRRIVALRWRHRLGPVQIAGRLAVGVTDQLGRVLARRLADRPGVAVLGRNVSTSPLRTS